MYGSSGCLDLRPDSTRQYGWCFTYLDAVDHTAAEADSNLVPLGSDPHVSIEGHALQQLRQALGVKFKSETLADIAAEILLMQKLPGRGLRPGADGLYKINLGGLLKIFTEDEAIEFVGKLRTSDLLGPRPHRPRKKQDLRDPLKGAMDAIEAIVNSEMPHWLQHEVAKVEKGRSEHSLASNWLECYRLLERPGWKHIHSSSAVIWILMLNRDISIARSHIDVSHLAARLRDINDCEPTKYELYVLAAYIQAGAQIEKTDAHRTGEFRVSWGD